MRAGREHRRQRFLRGRNLATGEDRFGARVIERAIPLRHDHRRGRWLVSNEVSGIWEPEGTKFIRNLAADLRPEDVSMHPWAEELYKERLSGALSKYEPDANCLPQGVPKINAAPVPWRIVQTPGVVVILYEAFGQWRQIFTDGRPLPADDPQPWWFGYSVGKWDGDTLVVETIGLRDDGWLDVAGSPFTSGAKITERFRRVNFGRLEIDITIDDPKAYTRPWKVTQPLVYQPDDELIEYICDENNRYFLLVPSAEPPGRPKR